VSADGVGLVFDIQPRPGSRREVRMTANDFGQTRVTLAAGALGTEDGMAVVAMAADRRALAYSTKRNRPRRKRVV